MQVVRSAHGRRVDKPDGTAVVYYTFPEYEIHFNQLLPGTTQEWHHHQRIEETIYVLGGNIEVLWVEDGGVRSSQLSPGDIVRVEQTPHTLHNYGDLAAQFIVLRLVLNGSDHHDTFQKDKVADPWAAALRRE